MKRTYNVNDECTMYFVVHSDEQSKMIVGWSDDKDIIDAYMEFHKCKDFKVKKYTDSARKMNDLLDENNNDEIELYNIKIRSNDKKMTKDVVVPMTRTEHMCVNDDTVNLGYTRLDYSLLNEARFYLKDKYQKALNSIFLEAAINKVLYNQLDNIMASIEVDELMILYKNFPDKFGT